jgi:hypothetical protein
MPLPRISIGLDSVTAAKCEKQPTIPVVRQAEAYFYGMLNLFRSAECGTDTV